MVVHLPRGQTLFAGYSDNLIRVWQVRFNFQLLVQITYSILLFTRCLLLAPGRSPATKKSPALPLLKKKHRRKLSWPCARSARCTVRSKLYVHIVLLALCAYAALPEFCGCNLNKLEGQNFLYLLAVHNQ